jgi:Mrp family chromosome partitioning ATPase
VAASLGVSNKLGLTDVLNGTCTLDQVLVHIPSLANLTVLPAHAGSERAGQLVCSDEMRKVLDSLRRDFQFIVIDSAPILPFADCRALSNLTDGLIFVGRSGITTRELVQRSLELLEQVHAAPVLQFVVNAADIKSPQYRYYQYGYEYYEPVSK